jgi:hypothetical protein
MAVLVLLGAAGASAQHGVDAAQLRRGPASIVLSVLITLTGLAGICALGLALWSLVTRERRHSDGPGSRRHSPVLIAAAAVAAFACLAALLMLATHQRHIQALSGLAPRPISPTGPTTNPLPFNTTASFATVSLVIGTILLITLIRIARTVGWRRSLNRLRPLRGESTEANDLGSQTQQLAEPDDQLGHIDVVDPAAEPDARRAVIRCYLRMLELVTLCGGEPRGPSETPTEYLRRILATPNIASAPAATLTGLFERARYSQQPVDELMRAHATRALGSLCSEPFEASVN